MTTSVESGYVEFDDGRLYYEAAYKQDGTVIGLRAKVIADVGAPSALCGWGQSFVTSYCIPTVYKIPNNRVQLFSVVTNKCPWNAYRGYGKEAASFLMDRIMGSALRKGRLFRKRIFLDVSDGWKIVSGANDVSK